MARSVARRGQRRAGRAAPGGPRRHPCAGVPRPAGSHQPRAARVGARPVPTAAQRLPPLHRRPSPVGGGGQRGRAGAPRPPPGPARAGRAAARPGQGLPGRPLGGRRRSRRAHRPSHGPGAGGRRGPPDPRAPAPPAARRRHPARPERRRHHHRCRRRPSAANSCWSCWPRSPRPTRWRPARRRGVRGRPSSSRSWSTGSAHVLGGGELSEATWSLFPSGLVTLIMAERRTAVLADGDRVTTVAPDRPGLFSRVAGVLSIHGLDVLGAQAHSDEQGMAANEFRVAPPARRRHRLDEGGRRSGAGHRRPARHRGPPGGAGPHVPSPARPGGRRGPHVRPHRQRRVLERHGDRGRARRTGSVSSTASPSPSPTWAWTSAMPGSRRWGPRWSTRSTCGTPTARSVDADHLAELERALLHAGDPASP